MSRAFRLTLITLAVCSCFNVAQANPTGANVAAGQANITSAGNTLTVVNSANAIINWQTFSIGRTEITRFQQPDAQSAVLNRVVGGDPSVLLGALQSNGRVFLVNPSGILVGAGARVDVAGLVASTLNLSDANFQAGKLRFDANPNAGSVINQGRIVTADGGQTYLVGPVVENAGSMLASNGTLVLAAGEAVEIGDTALPGIKVEITGDGTASNIGDLVAAAGKVGIVGAMVKNSGVIKVDGVEQDGGRVFLRATRTASVTDGTISANGQRGGLIQVEGTEVSLDGTTSLHASGIAGGGTILVGGDFQGKNGDVRNAQQTRVGTFTSLQADAKDSGNGGKVIVWSDDSTIASGRISAQGGTQGGDGGLVEVSGKHQLAFKSSVTTAAPQGRTGTLLLDPTDIDIVDPPSEGSSGVFAGGVFSPSVASPATLYWDDVIAQLASNNVVIQTVSAGTDTGNISVLGRGNYSSVHDLSLLAENNLTVSAQGGGIANTGSGKLVLVAGWNSSSGYVAPTADNALAVGNMLINGDVVSGGLVSFAAKGAMTLNALVHSTANRVRLASGGDLTINLPSTANFSYVDDDFFEYIFPTGYTFDFFGTNYDRAYISSNGLITFGSGTSAFSDSLGGLGAYRAISAAWNDWEINTSLRQSIEITRPTGNELAVKWDVGRYFQSGQSSIFEAVMNGSNGNINFNYGRTSTNFDSSHPSFAGDVTIGLSGGSAQSVLASQLMSLPGFSMDNLLSTTFSPSGQTYSEVLSTTGGALRSTGAVLYSSDQGFSFSTSLVGNTTVQASTDIMMTSTQGRIFGFGGISTSSAGGGLVLDAATGISLDGQYNQVSALQATTSSGGLSFQDHNAGNPGALDVTSANVGGDLSITNFGATIVGTVSPGIIASGQITLAANSPLTVGSFGVSSTGGGAVSLAANNGGALSLGGPVSTSGVTNLFGGTVSGAAQFAPGAIVNGQGGTTAPVIPTNAVSSQQQAVVSSLPTSGPFALASNTGAVNLGLLGQLINVAELQAGATLASGTIGGDSGEFGGTSFNANTDSSSQDQRNGKQTGVPQCN